MAISKTETVMAEKTLESMSIEIAKLKAILLPKAKVGRRELNELKRIHNDMLKGNKISAREFIKEMRAARS